MGIMEDTLSSTMYLVIVSTHLFPGLQFMLKGFPSFFPHTLQGANKVSSLHSLASQFISRQISLILAKTVQY